MLLASVLAFGGGESGPAGFPNFEGLLSFLDTNKDGKITRAEVMATSPPFDEPFTQMDADGDGTLTREESEIFVTSISAGSRLMALKLGGRGDLTDQVLWKYTKSTPNVPSPLVYQGIAYALKEGGVLTALDAVSGKSIKQARLTGALGDYFASPVAGDGKLYMVSRTGQVSVLKAAGEWEILAVNDLDEECFATPALADGRIYVRTKSALYCFSEAR